MDKRIQALITFYVGGTNRAALLERTRELQGVVSGNDGYALSLLAALCLLETEQPPSDRTIALLANIIDGDTKVTPLKVQLVAQWLRVVARCMQLAHSQSVDGEATYAALGQVKKAIDWVLKHQVPGGDLYVGLMRSIMAEILMTSRSFEPIDLATREIRSSDTLLARNVGADDPRILARGKRNAEMARAGRDGESGRALATTNFVELLYTPLMITDAIA